MINYDQIPAIYRHRMKGYLTRGISPGPFLTAVLGGELFEATRQASSFDSHCLGSLVKWLMTEPEIPAASFGSPDVVGAWIRAADQPQQARVVSPRADEVGPTPQTADVSEVAPTATQFPRGN